MTLFLAVLCLSFTSPGPASAGKVARQRTKKPTQKGGASMRRIVIPALLIATAVAVLAPAGSAQADRTPVTIMPFTLPASRCGFAIHVGVVRNNEYQDVTTLADGTTITNITGNLVLSFTNDVNGKSIVRNVSGPTTETDHPDGSVTFVGRGPNWFGIGPTGQHNTGEPGLVFTSGLATLQIANGVVQTFSLSGTQENGCLLLAS
jgi:hypothetical protein